MKKILMTLAAVLCCAMTTTMLTACGDDDDNNNSPKDEPAKAEMECEVYTSSETLEALDFYFTYYDESGNVKTEKITWSDNVNDEGYLTWKKKVSAKLPATLGALCEMKAKDGIDLDGQYTITHGYKIGFKSLAASGKTISEYNPEAFTITSRNKQGKLVDFLNEGGKFLNILYKYDSNGKGAGSGTWE